MCTVYAAEMHLCQSMFIGDAELAGDLFEIAGLLVSELVRFKQNIRESIAIQLKLGKFKVYVNKMTPAVANF